MIKHGQGTAELNALRGICQACPVSGPCLRQAVEELPYDRVVGPVRLGFTGRRWVTVRALAYDLGIESDEDFDALAAWLLDGLVKLNRVGGHRWVAELLDDDVA